MEIQRQNGVLSVRGLRHLNGDGAHALRDKLGALLTPEVDCIEIDLSQVASVDSRSVALLQLLYEAVKARSQNGGVALRLLDLQPPVRQMCELTRIHHLFEIVPAAGPPK